MQRHSIRNAINTSLQSAIVDENSNPNSTMVLSRCNSEKLGFIDQKKPKKSALGLKAQNCISSTNKNANYIGLQDDNTKAYGDNDRNLDDVEFVQPKKITEWGQYLLSFKALPSEFNKSFQSVPASDSILHSVLDLSFGELRESTNNSDEHQIHLGEQKEFQEQENAVDLHVQSNNAQRLTDSQLNCSNIEPADYIDEVQICDIDDQLSFYADSLLDQSLEQFPLDENNEIDISDFGQNLSARSSPKQKRINAYCQDNSDQNARNDVSFPSVNVSVHTNEHQQDSDSCQSIEDFYELNKSGSEQQDQQEEQEKSDPHALVLADCSFDYPAVFSDINQLEEDEVFTLYTLVRGDEIFTGSHSWQSDSLLKSAIRKLLTIAARSTSDQVPQMQNNAVADTASRQINSFQDYVKKLFALESRLHAVETSKAALIEENIKLKTSLSYHPTETNNSVANTIKDHQINYKIRAEEANIALEEAQSKACLLEKEISGLEMALKRKELEENDFIRELKALENTVKEHKDDILSLKSEAMKLTAHLSVCQNEKNQAETQVQTLKRSLEELKARFSDDKENFDVEIKCREEANQKLLTLLDEREKDVVLRDEEIEILQKKITRFHDLERMGEKSTISLENMQRELTLANEKLQLSKTEFIGLQSENEKLMVQNSLCEHGLEEAVQLVERQTEEIHLLKGKLWTVENTLSSEKESCENYATALEQLRSTVQSYENSKTLSPEQQHLGREREELFMKRLGAALNIGNSGSDIETVSLVHMIERVEILMTERSELQENVDELRETLAQKDLELVNIQLEYEKEKAQIKTEYDVILSEKDRDIHNLEQEKENVFKELENRKLADMDTTIEYSEGDKSTDGMTNFNNSIQIALGKLENVIIMKENAVERNRNVIEKVEKALEQQVTDAETDRKLLMESQVLNEELMAIITIQETIIKNLQNTSFASEGMDAAVINTLEEHVAQLRELWQTEVQKNSELRNLLQENELRLENAPDENLIDEYKVAIKELEEKMSEIISASQKERQKVSEKWHHWLEMVYERVCGEKPTESVTSFQLQKTIEEFIYHTKTTLKHDQERLLTLEKRNTKYHERLAGLVTQKRALLYLFSITGFPAPHVNLSSDKPSLRQRFRSAVLSVVIVTKLQDLVEDESNAVIENQNLISSMGTSIMHHDMIPSPQWVDSEHVSIPFHLAMKAVPQLEKALSERVAQVHELEGLLASMHLKVATAENDAASKYRKEINSLVQDNKRISRELVEQKRNYQETKRDLEQRTERITHELRENGIRLAAEKAARQNAEARSTRYLDKLQHQSNKYQTLKQNAMDREKAYKTAVEKLREKVELSQALNAAEIMQSDKENQRSVRSPNRQGTQRESKEQLMKSLKEKRSKAGTILKELLASAEQDLAIACESDQHQRSTNKTARNMKEYVKELRETTYGVTGDN